MNDLSKSSKPQPMAARSDHSSGSAQKKDGGAPEQMLTVEEVADRLGVSRKTIYRRINAGDLVAVRDGRMVRITPEALRRYVAARLSA